MVCCTRDVAWLERRWREGCLKFYPFLIGSRIFFTGSRIFFIWGGWFNTCCWNLGQMTSEDINPMCTCMASVLVIAGHAAQWGEWKYKLWGQIQVVPLIQWAGDLSFLSLIFPVFEAAVIKLICRILVCWDDTYKIRSGSLCSVKCSSCFYREYAGQCGISNSRVTVNTP